MVFNNNARWAIGSNKSQFSAGYRQSLIILLCETQVEGDCLKMRRFLSFIWLNLCMCIFHITNSHTANVSDVRLCSYTTQAPALQRVRDDEEKGQK